MTTSAYLLGNINNRFINGTFFLFSYYLYTAHITFALGRTGVEKEIRRSSHVQTFL
jgi:hypothetical protein